MVLAKLAIVTISALLCLRIVQSQETNICNFPCVGEVYNTFCGGAVCVSSVINQAQFDALCSETCFGALSGPPLLDCFTSSDPTRPDFAAIQRNLVADVRSFCGADAPTPVPVPAPALELAPAPAPSTALEPEADLEEESGGVPAMAPGEPMEPELEPELGPAMEPDMETGMEPEMEPGVEPEMEPGLEDLFDMETGLEIGPEGGPV